jgi:hypothetical protein
MSIWPVALEDGEFDFMSLNMNPFVEIFKYFQFFSRVMKAKVLTAGVL